MDVLQVHAVARIQGYLVHKKMPTPLEDPLRPYAWAYGGVLGECASL